MSYKSMREVPIDPRELHFAEKEFERFLASYSDKHIHLRMLVAGYEVMTEEDETILVGPLTYEKVIEYKDGGPRIPIFKYTELLSTILAYIFDERKNHAFRIMAGDGQLFPIPRIYRDWLPTITFLVDTHDLRKDWALKEQGFRRAADHFMNNQNEALPFMWYGKAVLSGSHIDHYLNCYRSVEVHSKSFVDAIRKSIDNKSKVINRIEDLTFEERSFLMSVNIPSNDRMKFVLKLRGIPDEKIALWKEYRNRLTHGATLLEIDEKFIGAAVEFAHHAKKLLDNQLSRVLGADQGPM